MEASLATSTPQRQGTKAVAATLGIAVGVSGLDHGLFEALQGDAPTPGLVIQAIGPAQRMWLYGTEEAFTLVPDFLATGLLAMTIGALTILWSIHFIDRPHGASVLLALGGLLALVGGGIGMLVFLLAGWAVARRIGRPIVPPRLLRSGPAAIALSRAWPTLIVLAGVLYAFALEVAIVGFVPGVTDPDGRLAICWIALLAMLVALALALLGTSVPSNEPGTRVAAASALPQVR